MISNKEILKAKAQELKTIGINMMYFKHMVAGSVGSQFGGNYLDAVYNWYAKYGITIDRLVDDKNQSDFIEFLDDYLCAGDCRFGSKYKMHRHEAPFIIISVLLIKDHYALAKEGNELVVHLAEQPFFVDNEYKGITPDLFEEVCPDGIRLRLPYEKGQSKPDFVSIGMSDDGQASAFCSMVSMSKPLTLAEVKELIPVMRKIANADSFNEEAAMNLAKFVKTALHHGLFDITKYKDGDKQDDVFDICLSCVMSYGLKHIGETVCH